MPPSSTVRWWVVNDEGPGFAARYACARDMGLDEMGDEIIEISDDASNDTVTDEQGNDRANTEWISRSKLRTENRKWLMSKLAHGRYGDKLAVEHSGDVSFGERLARAREKPADGDPSE